MFGGWLLRRFHHRLLIFRHQLADLVTGPLALTLLPITLVLVYALGTSLGLLLALVLLPSMAVLMARADVDERQSLSLPPGRKIECSEGAFEQAMRAALYSARLRQTGVLCMVIDLHRVCEDNANTAPTSHGNISYEDAVFIRRFLRRQDQIFVLDRHQFGIVLNTKDNLSEEGALTFGTRMHADIMQAAGQYQSGQISATRFGISVSTKGADPSATDMLNAAKTAIKAAREKTGSDVQVVALVGKVTEPQIRILEGDIESAVTGPGICGWFQPQICTQTGVVTGFEALARWEHPTEGLIPPSEFLPVLQRLGMMPLLQDRMMSEAFDGFEAWRGLMDHPPSVGINLAPEDLLDPTLPDRIMWELDRRKIDPGYLTIEILEMVIATSRDDVISQNIRRLAEMGCRVDLDDFGTGHASISTLQQVTVHRLKIDRSFITGLVEDKEKQNMVSAILTMAGQLGLDTLAEGVETSEEETCLTRLGCGHLQGFGIARPMPLDDTLQWLAQRRDMREENSDAPRRSGSKTG